MSEQAAQKALKAYLIYKGRRYVWEHSIQELAKLCMKYDKKFRDIIDAGMILDKFYIPTRYPDALTPPAVPYKSYREEDAVEAIKTASDNSNDTMGFCYLDRKHRQI